MISSFDTFYPGDGVILLIFNSLIQITIAILLTMFVVGRFLRHAPAASYAAWLACLAFVVVCPVVTAAAQHAELTIVSLSIAPDTVAPASSVAPAAVPSIATETMAGAISNSSQLGSHEVESRDEDSSPMTYQQLGVAEGSRFETSSDVRPRGIGFGSDDLQPFEVRAVTPLTAATKTSGFVFRRIIFVLLALWCAGSLLCGIRLLRGGHNLWRLRRQTRALDESAFAGVLKRVRRTLNATDLPPILLSEQITTPVVAGIFRPNILLPAALPTTISENSLHDVLVHEYAHIVRRDLWVGAIQRLVEVVYWPHPLVYHMNGQLARYREEVCDNYVLAGVDPVDYSETLLELTLHCQQRIGLFSSIGVFGLRWRLEDRVQGLLDSRRDRSMRLANRSRLAVVASASIALAAAAVLQVGSAADDSEAETATQSVAPTSTTSEQTPKDAASESAPPAIRPPLKGSAAEGAKSLPAQPTALATADDRTDIYGDSLPTGAVARLGTVRYRAGDSEQGMVFLPGSHQLIASSSYYGLQVWDADTGKLWRPISPPDGNRRPFGVSPDGKSVAAITPIRGENRQYTNRLTVWDVPSREVKTEIEWTEPTTAGTEVIAFTPDGKTIATGGGRSGKLRFWDLQSKSELLSYSLEGDIRSIAFAPDGELSAVSTDRSVVLWKWRSGEKPEAFNIGPRGAMAVAFSPDGKWLASGSDELRGIRVWQVANRQLVWRVQATEVSYYPQKLAFTPDSKLLAIPLEQHGGRVELREAATGNLVRSFDADQVSMRGVAISSDQQLIAGQSGSPVGSAFKVWRLETGEPLHREFAGHEDAPDKFECTADSSRAVTAGYDGTVRVWDAMSGRQLHQMQHDDARSVAAIAVSPDAKWVASAGFDYTLRLWNMETGEQRYRLRGHAEVGAFRSNTVRLTPDSSQLLSFGNDLYLRIWDIRTGKALQEFEVRPSNVEFKRDLNGTIKMSDGDPFGGPAEGVSRVIEDVQFTSDCRHLLLSSKGEIQTIDTSSGQEVGRFKLGGGRTDFAVSADGKRLATLEAGPVVRVRDYGSPDQVLCEIKLPTERGRRLALSPTGDLVALTAYQRLPDGQYESWIGIWDAATGREYARINQRNSDAIGFLPNGKRIATSSPDTSVLIWDLDELSRKK